MLHQFLRETQHREVLYHAVPAYLVLQHTDMARSCLHALTVHLPALHAQLQGTKWSACVNVRDGDDSNLGIASLTEGAGRQLLRLLLLLQLKLCIGG